MQYVFLILVGLTSGVFGGMGMGGGTLLIPLLTLLFSFNQKVAQGINLISFSIMACIVLIIHLKNKLIDVKVAIGFSVVAILTSLGGAFLANITKTGLLRICFGILLVVVAIYETIIEILNLYKNNNNID